MNEFYWALAIGAIGALLGLFFALNGFAEPIKPTDLKNSARVRNLLWLVTGAVGVILADWRRLAGSAPDAGFLLVSYLLGAIAGAIFGLSMIVVFLALSIWHANRRRGEIEPLPYSLIVDYLHHGSIPISSRFGPMGVINIESNRLDLLGEGEEIGKAVCTTLQPFAALLSRVL